MGSTFSRGLVFGFVFAFLLMAIVQQLTNLNRNTAVVEETSSQAAKYDHQVQMITHQDGAITGQVQKLHIPHFNHQVTALPKERISDVSKSSSVKTDINQPREADLPMPAMTSLESSASLEEALSLRPLANIDNRLSQLRSFGVGAYDKMKEVIAGVIEKGSVDGEGAIIAGDESSSGTVSMNSAKEVSVGGYSNSSSTNNQYTRRYCESKRFNKLAYLPESNKQLPAMLYTFPGSGNTWGRLLIEHATGIFTGSVYNDQSLLDALPGEFTCDWRVSVVKVHPHTHTFADLYSGHFASDNGKCKRGGVMRFERAVLLIRNPFDSIWSEYQRRVTQSHVEGILRKTFDWSRWQANAASLSNSYNEMWSVHYRGIEEKYEPEDILYLRYEDLKSKKTRVATLKRVVDFLKIKVTGDLLSRLECAFALSESTQAHRSIDPDVDMTKEVAYTKELACRMYALFGKHIEKHNYTTWKNWDCSGYQPIPKINVGPRGEYNRLWVRPGAALLDFGGHEISDFDPNAAPKKGNGGRGGAGRGAAGAGRGAAGAGRGRTNAGRGAAVRNNAFKQPGAVEAAGSVVERPLPVSIGKSVGGGMSMQEASSISGVGTLGSKKPAWE